MAELDLTFAAGELTVLVGPSGCGKTTTMKMINRIIEPTTGRILLGGEDVTGVDPVKLRRRIGYVIQNVGLFPHQTIRTNVGTVPRLLGWDKQRIRDRVDELLTRSGWTPPCTATAIPHQLSGGQRQRAGVARALAADPRVLLMDEPFSAVDPVVRERLQSEFLRLQETVRKTIVFVTHDIEEAVRDRRPDRRHERRREGRAVRHPGRAAGQAGQRLRRRLRGCRPGAQAAGGDRHRPRRPGGPPVG